jgi:hypothetical protein
MNGSLLARTNPEEVLFIGSQFSNLSSGVSTAVDTGIFGLLKFDHCE